jgi:hypothetical protein
MADLIKPIAVRNKIIAWILLITSAAIAPFATFLWLVGFLIIFPGIIAAPFALYGYYLLQNYFFLALGRQGVVFQPLVWALQLFRREKLHFQSAAKTVWIQSAIYNGVLSFFTLAWTIGESQRYLTNEGTLTQEWTIFFWLGIWVVVAALLSFYAWFTEPAEEMPASDSLLPPASPMPTRLSEQ